MKISNRKIHDYIIYDIPDDMFYSESIILSGYVIADLPILNTNVVLNFANVNYINSLAHTNLIELQKMLKSKKIQLFLMNINNNVMKMMKTAGIDHYFDIISDEQYFIKEVRKAETGKMAGRLDWPAKTGAAK
jgi:hypothetical protein